MTFNPLGNFNPSAPIDAGVLQKAKAVAASLPAVPNGALSRLYLHWTVAPFGCTFGDYNGEADFENGNWKMVVTHDPRDNAAGLTINPAASHTWHRNTGAVGVSIAGMTGATEHNFGPDAVTLTGLEHLCACAAAFASRYGIDALGAVTQGGNAHRRCRPGKHSRGAHDSHPCRMCRDRRLPLRVHQRSRLPLGSGLPGRASGGSGADQSDGFCVRRRTAPTHSCV